MEEELGCLDMYFLLTEKFALSSVVFMPFKNLVLTITPSFNY